jgi:hypothetical protein
VRILVRHDVAVSTPEAALLVWAVGSFAVLSFLLVRSGRLTNPKAWAAAVVPATAFLIVSAVFGPYDWQRIAFVFGGIATGVLIATMGHPVDFLGPALLIPMERENLLAHERRQRTVVYRFIWLLIAVVVVGIIVIIVFTK